MDVGSHGRGGGAAHYRDQPCVLGTPEGEPIHRPEQLPSAALFSLSACTGGHKDVSTSLEGLKNPAGLHYGDVDVSRTIVVTLAGSCLTLHLLTHQCAATTSKSMRLVGRCVRMLAAHAHTYVNYLSLCVCVCVCVCAHTCVRAHVCVRMCQCVTNDSLSVSNPGFLNQHIMHLEETASSGSRSGYFWLTEPLLD